MIVLTAKKGRDSPSVGIYDWIWPNISIHPMAIVEINATKQLPIYLNNAVITYCEKDLIIDLLN